MSDRLEELVSKLLALSTTDDSGAHRLPPERDLGASLDMSRGALREQLALLEHIGVLHRRQGSGSVLDAPDVSFIRTYFTLMQQLGYLSDDEFSRAREMLEVIITAVAAERATPEDVERLGALVDLMIERTSAGDAPGAFEADLVFHNMLYAIVDNPIFNMLNEGFSHVLRANIKARRELALAIEEPAADGSLNTDSVHRGIVDALAAHDPGAATAAMRKHFADFSTLTTSERKS